jgi:hypothetical protein
VKAGVAVDDRDSDRREGDMGGTGDASDDEDDVLLTDAWGTSWLTCGKGWGGMTRTMSRDIPCAAASIGSCLLGKVCYPHVLRSRSQECRKKAGKLQPRQLPASSAMDHLPPQCTTPHQSLEAPGR